MSFRILFIETNPIARIGVETNLLQQSLSQQSLSQQSTHAVPPPYPKFVGNLQEAYEHLHREHVDVIVTDKKIEQLSAYDLASELRKTAPDMKFVLWAFADSHIDIVQAVVHGFFEFIPRNQSANEFVESMRAISKGCRPNNSLVQRFSDFMTKQEWPTLTLQEGVESTELTRREMQIIALLALGLNNHDIGSTLKIRLDTTKEHVQNILRKLNLPDRTAVAVWAMKNAAESLQIPAIYDLPTALKVTPPTKDGSKKTPAAKNIDVKNTDAKNVALKKKIEPNSIENSPAEKTSNSQAS